MPNVNLVWFRDCALLELSSPQDKIRLLFLTSVCLPCFLDAHPLPVFLGWGLAAIAYKFNWSLECPWGYVSCGSLTKCQLWNRQSLERIQWVIHLGQQHCLKRWRQGGRNAWFDCGFFHSWKLKSCSLSMDGKLLEDGSLCVCTHVYLLEACNQLCLGSKTIAYNFKQFPSRNAPWPFFPYFHFLPIVIN